MNHTFGEFTSASPEGVVKAPKGTRFFRDNDRFFISNQTKVTELGYSKKAYLQKFRNEPWFEQLHEDIITFSTPYESWIKVGHGNTSKGWVKTSSKRSFVTSFGQSAPLMGDIASVAGGTYFSYFLKTNGELWTAGENWDGQLGRGFTSLKETASLVMTDVKMIATNCEAYHGAAVKNDGTLWFAGNGNDGQFGDGAEVSYDTFTQVDISGFTTGSIKEIAVGNYYTALLIDDGTLWFAGCEWDCHSTFTQLDSEVSTISGGGYHLLYVKTDDTLWGVGNNYDGQLGLGSTSYENSPVQIDTGVSKAFAGGYHSAYIKTDNTMWMTGANWDGQLGVGDENDRNSPIQVDTDVSFAALGDSHTVYIKNGNLYGMGYNGDGELGNGTWLDVYEPTLMATGVSFAACGEYHTMYITISNMLYGMGYNDTFQLGSSLYPLAMINLNGSWVKSTLPYEYSDYDFSYWKDAIYFDGKFLAGGGDESSKIIYTSTGETWQTASVPDVYHAITGFASDGIKVVAVSNVSAGTNEGRAESFTSTDGINWTSGSLNNTSWNELDKVTYGGGLFVASGENRIVTSPDGYTWTEQSIPFSGYVRKVQYGAGKYAGFVQWGGIGNTKRNLFTQTFNGNTVDGVVTPQNSAAVLKDGMLFVAGENDNGILGLGTTNETYTFVNSPMTDVRNVGGGRYHIAFVKTDGTLWGIGNNGYGQLGDGTTINRYSPVLIDTNVSKSFAGLGNLTVYVKNDGTLWGCGENWAGALGTASLYGSVTQSVYIDSNVVHAAFGTNHIVYIKNDGTFWGQGWNGAGQLGTGNSFELSPVQLDSGSIYCTTGWTNTFYIKSDNSLYGMGVNNSGQLGLGDSINRTTSTFITSSVTSVAAGYDHAMIVATDGKVYGAGYNGDGGLGVGNYTTYYYNFQYATDSGSYLRAINNFSYLVKTDGTVWATGQDYSGQLGLGRYVEKGLYSSDAANWTSSLMPQLYYQDVAYGNGKFAAIGDNNMVSYSSNGIDWSISYLNTGSAVNSRRLIFDGTKFLCVADNADYGYNLYTSTDAINWTKSSLGENSYWNALAYGDGKYVVLSNGYTDYANMLKNITL